MTTKRASLAMASLLLISVSTAQAEGWRDWVPFAKKDESKATVKKTSTSPDFGSQRPGVSQSRPKLGGQPNMLERMGTGTKEFFGNFFSNKETSKKRPGTHSGWDRPMTVKKKTEEKPSFLSWFRREEPRPSATIDEFLRQPRPEG